MIFLYHHSNLLLNFSLHCSYCCAASTTDLGDFFPQNFFAWYGTNHVSWTYLSSTTWRWYWKFLQRNSKHMHSVTICLHHLSLSEMFIYLLWNWLWEMELKDIEISKIEIRNWVWADKLYIKQKIFEDVICLDFVSKLRKENGFKKEDIDISIFQ